MPTAAANIDRSIAEVFALLADLTTHPTWSPDVLSATQITTGPVGLGARFKLKPSPARSRSWVLQTLAWRCGVTLMRLTPTAARSGDGGGYFPSGNCCTSGRRMEASDRSVLPAMSSWPRSRSEY